MKFLVRQLTVLIALSGRWLSAAELADLKTFTSQESYVVEGVSIVLTQKVGEATVKVGPALKDSSTLTAANGAKFDLQRELPSGIRIYKMQSAGTFSEADSKAALDSLNQDARIEYAYPVYANAATGNRHFLNDEVVVRLKAALDPGQTDLAAVYSLELIETLNVSENIYVFRLTQPKNFNAFAVCRALLQRVEVIWAEPNMGQEVQQFVIPNDTSFASEWNLRNTGQTFAFSDADVDADEAWDGSQGYGSAGIRIAIVDDGVQTAHPDLAANIVQGYDFFGSDTDPNPVNANDNHGTAVAGVAAAAVNNSAGIAGAAGKCKILPVRIIENGVAVSATSIYRALVYAADNADVINCSWGTSSSSTITSGFSYAYSSGREGKGCPVLCASGNFAGGDGANSYETLQAWTLYPTFPAGNYFFGFAYVKDANGSANDDCFWLADVRFPYGALERFDSGTLPPNWTTTGNGNWAGTIDPVHSHGTTRFAWRSGAVGDSQNSILVSPLATLDATHPTLWFRTWISSQQLDQAQLLIFNDQSQLVGQSLIGQGAVADRTTAVSYPANLSYVLAVGASTDFDYRSHYSQYDSTLDFVTSSSGGYGDVITTDRTGSAGYGSTDYFLAFGGTSASAPLAAGIAALVLSKDGNLTRSMVASRLNQNCDKIGPIAYTGTPPLTRNDYYGYGRVNAKSSVNATTADTTAPTFTTGVATLHYRAVDVTFSEPMGEGAEDPTKYQIIAGAGTLSTSPNKVLRIRPTMYRLIWNAGDLAESGLVTLQADSSIKDVAGNFVTGTLSRNTYGTKRIIGVDCGALGTDAFAYNPPFISDNGFQGNEPAQFLTGSFESFSTPNYIDISGVTDPAPISVYETCQISWTSSPMTYSFANLPAQSLTVRLHFAQIHYAFQYYGAQYFDISINSTLKTSRFDIWAAAGGAGDKAVVMEYPNITPLNGAITVTITPQLGDGGYTGEINAIEIVKP